MTLRPTELTRTERELQREVHEYLDRRLVPGTYERSLGMPGVCDPQFSRDLGARCWIGMSISPEYGGPGRNSVERLIVVEELLTRGAPVSYHWVANRQSGPSVQRFGTEEQKRQLSREAAIQLGRRRQTVRRPHRPLPPLLVDSLPNPMTKGLSR